MPKNKIKDASPAANNNKMTQESLGAGEKTMENVEVHYNSNHNYWEKKVITDQEFQNGGESAYDETRTVSITVLRFALKIGDIMEAIVNSLDDQHLDLWYETCKAFKFHDLKDMDRICWKKRAAKLAAVIGIRDPIEKLCPEKPFREIFTILRPRLDDLISHIRGILSSSPTMWPNLNPGDTAAAASLAYHGLLWPFRALSLRRMDLSTVPAEHLASLVSCVTKRVVISEVSGCDMVSILNCVKSKFLSLHREKRLDNEETSALVRAMETRVEQVVLGGSEKTLLDVTALIQYSGQGRCQLIDMIEDSDDEEKYEDEMKNWAEDKQWSITNHSNSSLLLRKSGFNEGLMVLMQRRMQRRIF